LYRNNKFKVDEDEEQITRVLAMLSNAKHCTLLLSHVMSATTAVLFVTGSFPRLPTVHSNSEPMALLEQGFTSTV